MKTAGELFDDAIRSQLGYPDPNASQAPEQHEQDDSFIAVVMELARAIDSEATPAFNADGTVRVSALRESLEDDLEKLKPGSPGALRTQAVIDALPPDPSYGSGDGGPRGNTVDNTDAATGFGELVAAALERSSGGWVGLKDVAGDRRRRY